MQNDIAKEQALMAKLRREGKILGPSSENKLRISNGNNSSPQSQEEWFREKTDLENNLSATKSRVLELEASLQLLKRKIEEILASWAAEVSALQDSRKSLQKKHDQLQNEQSCLLLKEAELTALKKMNSELESKIQSLKAEFELVRTPPTAAVISQTLKEEREAFEKSKEAFFETALIELRDAFQDQIQTLQRELAESQIRKFPDVSAGLREVILDYKKQEQERE